MNKEALAIAYSIRKRAGKRYAKGGEIPPEKLDSNSEVKVAIPMKSKIADKIMKKRKSSQLPEEQNDFSIGGVAYEDLDQDLLDDGIPPDPPVNTRRKILDGIMRSQLK